MTSKLAILVGSKAIPNNKEEMLNGIWLPRRMRKLYWVCCELAACQFADMDPNTLCIDLEDIEKRITDRTKAIIVAHYLGHPADMDRWLGSDIWDNAGCNKSCKRYGCNRTHRRCPHDYLELRFGNFQ